MDVFNRLLGTTQITLAQFGWALLPALALLVLWELGKLVARVADGRRGRQAGGPPIPAPTSDAAIPLPRPQS